MSREKTEGDPPLQGENRGGKQSPGRQPVTCRRTEYSVKEPEVLFTATNNIFSSTRPLISVEIAPHLISLSHQK